jgi:hypothetical protein
MEMFLQVTQDAGSAIHLNLLHYALPISETGQTFSAVRLGLLSIY